MATDNVTCIAHLIEMLKATGKNYDLERIAQAEIGRAHV